MEKGNVERMVAKFPLFWESVWRDVSHRDEPIIIHQPSWWGFAAEGDSLVAYFDWSRWSGSESPVFLWGWIVLKNLTLPPYRAYKEGRGGVMLIRCTWESPFTPELDSLPQDTTVERCFLLCSVGVHLVGRRCLASGGLLGDRRSEWCSCGFLGGTKSCLRDTDHLLQEPHQGWKLPPKDLWWATLWCSCIGDL